MPPPALAPVTPEKGARPVVEFLKDAGKGEGKDDKEGLGRLRGDIAERELNKPADPRGGSGGGGKAKEEARDRKKVQDEALKALRQHNQEAVQTGKLGVDIALQTAQLRAQSKLERTAVQQVQGRTLLDVGGVWVDQGFTDKNKLLVVKAQSDAYFRILERHPLVKDVYRLGNHLVWITPSGTALIVDANDGKDKLTDKEIDQLFAAGK